MSSNVKIAIALLALLVVAQAGTLVWVTYGKPAAAGTDTATTPVNAPPPATKASSIHPTEEAEQKAERKEEERKENLVASTLNSIIKDGKSGKATESSKNIALARQLLAKGRSAIKGGDYRHALDLLRQSVNADPSNGDSYRELASAYRKLGRTDDELQTYQDWMNARPQDAEPHYQLAKTFQNMGMQDQYRSEMNQFRAMNTGSYASPYEELAAHYRRQDMHEEEGQVLSQWMQEDPQSEQAVKDYAEYLRRGYDQEGALAQYQAALQLNPNDPENYLAIGDIYTNVGFAHNLTQTHAASCLQDESMRRRIS